jgi:hypothetical protein
MKLTNIRNKFGFIPEDFFENEPSGPPKTPAQWREEWAEKTEPYRDKYRPGDVVGGY